MRARVCMCACAFYGDVQRNRVGLDIYDEFIADMAPRQVNVESRVYRQLKEAKDSGFENTTFDAAQREVC